MNPMCELPAKVYTKRVSGKPVPQKSKAIVGRLPVRMLQAINPQRTPVSAYTKKQPK